MSLTPKIDVEVSKKNLEEISHLHDIATKKVNTAISSLKEAVEAVSKLEKLSHNINDPTFYQFTKRIHLNNLFQDLNIAQLKLSSTLKRNQTQTKAHVQSIESVLESELQKSKTK